MSEPRPLFGRIQKTYEALFRRLRVYDVSEFGIPVIQRVMVPVALVESDVTLSATAIPIILGVPASAGPLTAPAINTVLADTGALDAGDWEILIWVSLGGTPDIADLQLERRNAANAANIWSHRWRQGSGAGMGFSFLTIGPARVTMAQDERLRIQTLNAAIAGQQEQANIFSRGPF